MGRPLRLFEPDGVYFVTGRCLQGRLLMRPSPETNAIIGGVLARALAVFDIDLFAFVFVSNHFHLLLRSRQQLIPPFMQYLRSNIAKKLGALVDWHGKFWDRRYDAEPVLDNDALVGRLRYILSHGVKEGLVARCRDWPGLTCLPELVEGRKRVFAWPRSCAEEDKTMPDGALNSLSLAVLPCWEGQDAETRSRMVSDILASVEGDARAARGNEPVLGKKAIAAQRPHRRPLSVKRSARPLCHASSPALQREYKAKYEAFVTAYREASAAYCAGQLDVEFPPHSYRPPGSPQPLHCAA